MRLFPSKVSVPLAGTVTHLHAVTEVPRASDVASVASAAVLPTAGINRILICRTTHSLGNTLLLTPLIRELEAVWPGAEIDIVARTPVARDVFGSFAQVRDIFTLPGHAFRHPLQFVGALTRLRRKRYDLAIDPYPRSGTGRTLLALAKATYKLGFESDSSTRFLTHRVPSHAMPKHTGHGPVYLLRSALQRAPRANMPSLDIALSGAEHADGAATLSRLLAGKNDAGKRSVVGIFANATGAKLLPGAWWQTFLDAFAARHPQCHFVEIVPAFGHSMLGSRFPTFYSSDVRRIAGVLSQLSLVISADCGIMHLASASGAPVAGIFSVTDSEEWGPYGPRDCVIDARDLSPDQVATKVHLPD